MSLSVAHNHQETRSSGRRHLSVASPRPSVQGLWLCRIPKPEHVLIKSSVQEKKELSRKQQEEKNKNFFDTNFLWPKKRKKKKTPLCTHSLDNHYGTLLIFPHQTALPNTASTAGALGSPSRRRGGLSDCNCPRHTHRCCRMRNVPVSDCRLDEILDQSLQSCKVEKSLCYSDHCWC